jgi:hypothetical protein
MTLKDGCRRLPQTTDHYLTIHMVSYPRRLGYSGFHNLRLLAYEHFGLKIVNGFLVLVAKAMY